MGLSSNTLVHLTIKKNSLIGILKEGFQLKYCHEDVTLRGIGLNVFDLYGNHIKELLNEFNDDGNHKIIWKGDDYLNNRMKSDIYMS